MRRSMLVLLVAVSSGSAADIQARDAGLFFLNAGKLKVPMSSLEKAVPLLKENGPEDITITFPVDYPIVGDATVPWSKEWYRSELTRLAAGADGWALRSITLKESGNGK